MKITYDIIKENIRVFEDAKSKFPIIQKYISGEIFSRSLVSVGLTDFYKFHDYLVSLSNKPLVMSDMTWRKLKVILIEKTDSPRFKTYIKNRTQKQFNEILNNPAVYDRLLNGVWRRKPNKRSMGVRSSERINALTSCNIEVLNYIICNDVDVCEYISGTEWFVSKRLSVDEGISREMKVTEEMLDSIVNVISNSKVDFKKLNLDYVTNYINEKLTKLISVERGSTIKCIRDVKTISRVTGNEVSSLTCGKSYKVEDSTMRNGYLHIWLTDDNNKSNYYSFSNFEDVQYNRSSILDSLFDD